MDNLEIILNNFHLKDQFKALMLFVILRLFQIDNIIIVRKIQINIIYFIYKNI